MHWNLDFFFFSMALLFLLPLCRRYYIDEVTYQWREVSSLFISSHGRRQNNPLCLSLSP